MKSSEYYHSSAYLSSLHKDKSPWPRSYCPEEDISLELTPIKVSHCQSLIGGLRHTVELGKCGLEMEVSETDCMMCLPREGHLSVVFQMFLFLNSKNNSVTVFDITDPEID